MMLHFQFLDGCLIHTILLNVSWYYQIRDVLDRFDDIWSNTLKNNYMVILHCNLLLYRNLKSFCHLLISVKLY